MQRPDRPAVRVNDNGVIRFYCRTIVVRCRRNDHNLQQLNVDTFEHESFNYMQSIQLIFRASSRLLLKIRTDQAQFLYMNSMPWQPCMHLSTLGAYSDLL